MKEALGGHSTEMTRSRFWFGILSTTLCAAFVNACSEDVSGADDSVAGSNSSGGATSETGAGGTATSSGGTNSSGGEGGDSGGIDDGRNVPSDGRVSFFLGQDTGTLEDFAAEVLDVAVEGTRAPEGVTLYTSLLPTTLHPNDAPSGAAFYLSGIEGPPVDEGNGTVDFAATLSRYDTLAEDPVALAVGLYLSDSWADCGNQPLRALLGRDDDDLGSSDEPDSLVSQWRAGIDRLIEWLADQERPVFLRIGYEFDGPWNCYNQDFYKAAYRYVKERIDALDASNVATVWQAATYPDDGDPAYDYQVSGGPDAPDVDAAIRAHYEAWYPGDDFVDWVGISFFSGANYLDYQWSCVDETKPWTVPDTSPRRLQDALADFGRDHEKPVLVAEWAPQGFDLGALTHSCVAAREDHLSGRAFADGDAAFDAFFADSFGWLSDNADVVRAFSYINTNWQAQSRWACAPQAAACSEGYWGDTRLQAQPSVLDRFFEALAELAP